MGAAFEDKTSDRQDCYVNAAPRSEIGGMLCVAACHSFIRCVKESQLELELETEQAAA